MGTAPRACRCCPWRARRPARSRCPRPKAAERGLYLSDSPLPDLTEDFAADLVPARFTIRHDALRRGHDRHAETGLDPGEPVAARVHTQSGLRHAFDPLDDRIAPGG